ncbi:tetratricopeptide repeat protein [Actinomadura luteofluorescens]|uniref:tetratricopeptide repeat protein n=1 Tax=Actinomadura luteofluorescens TaxID=46163 RepID=UPI003498D78F
MTPTILAWFAAALTDSVRPRLGVSALRNIRAGRRSIGPPNAVVPHDYLVQDLLVPQLVPAALWEAALAHCPASEAHHLAQSALTRHQSRLAAAFLYKGVAVSSEARTLLAREIHQWTDDPLPWLRHLAEQDTLEAVWAVIGRQDELDLAERRRWWKVMLKSEEKAHMHDLRGLLMESGVAGEAERWLADAAAEGDPLAPAALATLLDGHGADRAEDRLRWWSTAQELKHYSAHWSVIHALDDLGRVDEADRLRLAEARAGSGWMYAEYATSRVRAGSPDEARDAVLEALAPGSSLTPKAQRRVLDMLRASDWPGAYPELAGFLTPESRPDSAGMALLKEAEGDLDTAEKLWTRASEFSPSGIVAFFERHGRLEDARRILEALDDPAGLLSFRLRHEGIEAAAETARHLMEEGKHTAAHRLAELLSGLDHPDEAERWFRIAAATDDPKAQSALIRFLSAQERHTEALTLARRLLPHSPRIPDLMRQAGHVEEAENLLRTAAITGGDQWPALVTFLEKAERHSEASAITRYGLEPDGSTSEPWEFPPAPGQDEWTT